MPKDQKNQQNRSDAGGVPGGGQGSKSDVGRAGPKKQWGDAEQSRHDPGATGSQKDREAQRRGQEAPGGGKR